MEAGTNAGHDAAAGVFENAHDNVEEHDEHSQADERFDRARAQHAVIDLKHVEGPGEHQKVGKHAEERHGQKELGVLAARGPEFAQTCAQIRR